MSTANSSDSPTLTTRAAARYLSVSEAGLHRWRRLGCGPAYLRLGKRSVRYRTADLEHYLAACVVTLGEG